MNNYQEKTTNYGLKNMNVQSNTILKTVIC